MKRFYTFGVAEIAAYFLVLIAVEALLMHPAYAAASAPAATGPAAAVSGASVELHIIADGIDAHAGDLKAMVLRLGPGGRGPMPQPGDTIRWVEVEHAENFDVPGEPPETRTWNGSHFMPVLVTPDASMDRSSTPGWNFVSVHPETNTDGTRVVAFSFDARGTKLFGELTTHWSGASSGHSRLAIIVGNKIVSAPRILDPITSGSGIITGGGATGFTEEEMNRVIRAMNANVVSPTTEPSGAGS